MKRIVRYIFVIILSITSLSVYADTHNEYQVTFDANGGKFSNNSSTNVISHNDTIYDVKYSHTSNVDDTGLKQSNYGSSWTNANITGTDRGDTSQAHVVTLSGASSITVDIYYNGESTSYDWACVWAGSHPSYNCGSDYSSAEGGKLGGSFNGSYTVNGNNLTSMGYKKIVIEGDTVTFGFRSDGGGYGNGYGYYAMVSRENNYQSEGEYQQPTRDGMYFIGWYTDRAGTAGNKADLDSINSNTTVYAKWSNIPFDIISGDLHTVGSELCLGDECFYVLGQDDDYTINLLSKYNLGDGNGFATPTNKQDVTAKGWYQGGNPPFRGSTPFATSCYWCVDNPPVERYVYNENSLLYNYVEDYVTYLKSLGADKISGRLMSKKDLEDAVNDGNHLDGGHLTETASNIQGKDWIYSTSYWLGSVYLNDYMWMVASESNCTTWAWGVDVTWGVRPVITLELERPPEPTPEKHNGKVKGETEIKENPTTGVFSYSVIVLALIGISVAAYDMVRKSDYFNKVK